jgi:D-glutamate cyclase
MTITVTAPKSRQSGNKISTADFVGEAIDQVITVEAKNPGLPHNVTRTFYQAARALVGDRPISMVCAEHLLKAVSPGDTVLILTGAGYPPHMPKGEDDGPPGAASLAMALWKGMGAVPVFVCEPCHVDPIVASSMAAGLMIKEFKDARDRRLGAALAVSPSRQGDVKAWVDRIFAEMKPKAVVTAERLGPAADGYLYNLTAQAYSGPQSTVEHEVIDISGIVTTAKDKGVLSIGIGDHGNEIGFGRIVETVAAAMPNGDRLCTRVGTDILLPAMMSNWGCYGIEAALAFLLKKPNLVHSPAQEERIIRACQMAGGIDAIFASTEFGVDGLDGETSMACMQFLSNIVRKSLEEPSTGAAH